MAITDLNQSTLLKAAKILTNQWRITYKKSWHVDD